MKKYYIFPFNGYTSSAEKYIIFAVYDSRSSAPYAIKGLKIKDFA